LKIGDASRSSAPIATHASLHSTEPFDGSTPLSSVDRGTGSRYSYTRGRARR
jgi:hypothetical protein